MSANLVLRLALPVVVCSGLGACTVMMSRESPLNEVTKDAPTALEVYRSGPGGGVPGAPGGASGASGASGTTSTVAARSALQTSGQARFAASGDARQSAYWNALEPMRQRFARLPNPDLVMVVYPHLAQGRYPVPGYVTTFPMYEEVHYVLPGELQGELQQAGQALAVARASANQGSSAPAPASRAGRSAGAGATTVPRGELSDGGAR
jgi:conjugative transfer region lipoprotein (TIGR03751 family)